MELKELDYKDRVINLFGNIEETTVKETIEKIVDINIKDSEYIATAYGVIGRIGFKINPEDIDLPPITLNLSTYGGSCYDGWGLCDAIKNSDTAIKIICYGKIMSMGIPILLSAKYKVAHKNTTFMIHGVSTFDCGKVQQIREDVVEDNRIEQKMIDYICSNSKFPRKKLQSIIEKKQDFYFTAEEALQYKIIDEIIE